MWKKWKNWSDLTETQRQQVEEQAAGDPQDYQYVVGPDGKVLEPRFAKWSRRQTWATSSWIWREGRASWDWWRWWWSRDEREVRGVLRAIARRRLSVIVMDKEGAVHVDEEVGFEAMNDLMTCYLRGWVEGAEHFASGRIEIIDSGISFRKPEPAPGLSIPSWYPPAWRLTDAGWNVIYRQRMFEYVTIVASLLLALLAL